MMAYLIWNWIVSTIHIEIPECTLHGQEHNRHPCSGCQICKKKQTMLAEVEYTY